MQDADGDHRPADRRPGSGRTADPGSGRRPSRVPTVAEAARPAPGPGATSSLARFPWSRSSASAPPSPSPGGSPSWPAPTSPSSAARSCSCAAPNGAGKTSLLRACAGLLAGGRRARPSVLGHDLTVAGHRRSAAPPGRPARPRHRRSTTTSPWPRTSASGAGPPAPTPPTSTPPWPASASTAAWPGCRSPACRPASAAAPSLACLVARRPELWLLDEPHAGLDQAGRDVVDGLLARRRRRRRHRAARQPRARPGRRRSPPAPSRSPAAHDPGRSEPRVA